jgi:hypothetical protein
MIHIDKILISIIIITLMMVLSCSENTVTNSDKTTVPQIQSLTTDKPEILFGGKDPAVITCDATGGNLDYTWEVDLGDIFPLKSDNSVVRFSASPCCLGKKIIKCTVTNDKGSETKNIEIFIKEQ